MKTTGKSRLGLKKALLLILYFCGILLISFFAFVYFLFKSPSFLDRAEQIINRQSKMPIEIGALSLTGWGRIAIKDLTLRESEKGEPIVVIPYAEIGLSPSVLFKKHIDEIEIKKPKLFITLKGRKDGEIKKGWPSLPFYLKKISIEDGEVIVRNETGMLVSFSGFALSIKEMPGRKAEVLASGDLRAPELRKEALQIIFKGEYDIDKFELDIENISISSPLAGAADIKGRLSMFPFKMQAELTADRVDLNKVVKKFVNILPDKGFALQGTAALRSAVSVDMSEGISGTISAIIDNGGFSSSDGAMAGEGIAVNLSGDLKYSLKDNTTEFSVTTHASDFELLLGSFYGDFTEKEISCSVQGKYFKNNDTLKISASEFSITDIGTIGASGDIRSISKTPRIDLDVRLKELANADAFAFFVQETFQDRFPFLSQMGISGKTSARLSVNGTKDAFNIQGNIDIKDADVFAEKSGLSVQGVNMSLPLDLSYPKITAPKKEAERFGSIRIRNISWKKQQAERIEFYPAVWQNTLVFKEDIQIPVFAGNIKLKNISYEKLLSPDRELHMSIDMNGIDLEQVSSSFNIPQFSGSLTGEIPSASITKGSLLTNGEIKIELFGGEIRISDLSVDSIFGPVPSISTSVEIKEIDLSRLTDTFEFGHISGVMQGYVRNLVIANSQAERFEALIETVRRKGVTQKISVEAINKISIMGTGSASAILSTGIYKLFEQYKYAKIGFKGKLKNDNFLLGGIVTEGNKEYIVKGGILPPKVNIISHTRNVSFQEMVKRLNSIKQIEKGEKIRVE